MCVCELEIECERRDVRGELKEAPGDELEESERGTARETLRAVGRVDEEAGGRELLGRPIGNAAPPNDRVQHPEYPHYLTRRDTDTVQ